MMEDALGTNLRLANVSHEKLGSLSKGFTGLSLRAGGRGFLPATQSMAPGYFRR